MVSSSGASAALMLLKQLHYMKKSTDIPGISVGLENENDPFKWEVMLMISDDCKFYGGKSPSPTFLNHCSASGR